VATVLVTGANRGLGLEFVRQYAKDGWNVLACCRYPKDAQELQALAAVPEHHIAVECLDVTDHAAIDTLADLYHAQPIDLLINNAGIVGPLPLRDHIIKQRFGTMDYELWEEVLRTNAIGPIKIAEAFVENVALSDEKKIICLSSRVGSNVEGDVPAFSYGSSKAALNKAVTLLAQVLRERGIIAAVLCPGHAKTRLGVGGDVEVEDSVTGMRRVIADLTLERTGTFTRYNGDNIPW